MELVCRGIFDSENATKPVYMIDRFYKADKTHLYLQNLLIC